MLDTELQGIIGATRFDHVGFAVESLESSMELFGRLYAVSFSEPEVVEAQGVRVSFASTGAGPDLELVQATMDRSPRIPLLPHPIKSFLERGAGGIHHVAFEVPAVADAMTRLADHGIGCLSDAPELGARGMLTTFLNPAQTQRILIELVEK